MPILGGLKRALQNALKSLGMVISMEVVVRNDRFLEEVYCQYMVDVEQHVSVKESWMLEN